MHLIAASWLEWLSQPANWLVIAEVAAGLGFVIFVHELGHFLVAKACGVKCEKFYLGFDIYGIKLLKFQAGETEYGIGILPLGGYVKMLGQDDNPSAQMRENERSRAGGQAEHHALPHGDLPAEPTLEAPIEHDPRSYLAKSVPQRMAIISAGVIMNVIFAFLMAIVAYNIGVKEVPCVVGSTVPGGAAWCAGLRTGDEIIQLGDVKHPTFNDLRQDVPVSNLEKGIKVLVKRPGVAEPIAKTLFPSSELGVPMIGLSSASDLTLISSKPVRKYSAASQAEPPLDGSDHIVAVDGQPISESYELYRPMIAKAGEPLKLTVERGGEGEEKPKAAEKQRVDVTIPPSPMKTLGMVMKIGPITGIQADSPASEAGLTLGDELLAIDGQPVGDPIALPHEVHKQMGKKVQLTVARDEQGKRTEKKIDVTFRNVDWYERPIGPGQPISIPELGIAYTVLNEVVDVVAGGPAAKQGIRKGDRILSALMLPTEEEKKLGETADPISFEKRPNWVVFASEVLQIAPGTVRLEVQSGDEKRPVDLQPVDAVGLFDIERGLNLEPKEFIFHASSMGEAVRLGGRKTVGSLMLVYRFLQKLGGQIPVTAVGGPVAIAGEAARQAKEGLGTFLLFLTMLSANLAVINFLPIPVLDGGHMVFLAIEGIRRKPVSERIVLAFHYAGFLFLVSLMLFVLGLDLGLISRFAQ